MQLIIHDYLSRIRERGELDAILPDLLRTMGFRIVKLAFRGEVEHGVDVAATKDEEGQLYLYLFQVKQGDVDVQMWDSGPNSVRSTLNNLLDVPFKDLTQQYLRKAKRKIVLVHNGTLRENVRERFNGYTEQELLPRAEFDRWDIERLTGYFTEYLLNEHILPPQHHGHLRRVLTFISVPDYDLIDVKLLVNGLIDATGRLNQRKTAKLFSLIRLVLAMAHRECATSTQNITPSLDAYEFALLALWGWMYKGNYWQEYVKTEYLATLKQYSSVLKEWIEKISPVLTFEDGLAMHGTFERVEFPMRFFRVIGNISVMALYYAYMVNFDDADMQEYEAFFEYYSSLLSKTIQNNSARHRPLLDNHSIEIFLGIWCLVLSGRRQEAFTWLFEIMHSLNVSKRFRERLPEVYNNLDLIIEYEATGERPVGYTDSSSALLYFLFELCLLFGATELYSESRQWFKDVHLQIWYPPADVEDYLYTQEILTGDTETILSLPSNIKDFYLDVEARHRAFDRANFSPLEQGFPIVLFLAHKYYRTPIFPFWWRSLIINRPENTEE